MILIRGIEANGYSGVKHVYFTIQPQNVAKKIRAKVNGKKFLYTGSELTPGVNLTYNKRKLTEGVDYVVSYSNNVEKGSARILITGIGNYTGSKTVKFKITGPKMKNAQVFTGTERNAISGYHGDLCRQDPCRRPGLYCKISQCQ